jgi:[protein-PII] uridylyltransferase
LGSSVIDVFGIVIPTLAAGDGSVRDELQRDLYAVLPAPTPAKPVSEAS